MPQGATRWRVPTVPYIAPACPECGRHDQRVANPDGHRHGGGLVTEVLHCGCGLLWPRTLLGYVTPRNALLLQRAREIRRLARYARRHGQLWEASFLGRTARHTRAMAARLEQGVAVR